MGPGGRDRLLTLPGGWSIYRLYPGGSELLRAWVMLPFHSDFAIALVDIVEWLALGLAVLSLGRALQAKKRSAPLAAVFVMLTPTVVRLVGSDYADLTLAFSMTAGALFGVRFTRSRRGPDLLLAVVSLSLAVGAKFSAALPAVAAIGVLSAVAVRARRASVVLWAAFGLLLAGAIVGPWMIANVRMAGYPLSPVPVSVFGTTLGQTNRAMEAYLGQPGGASRTFDAELKTVAEIFAWPPKTEALGVQTLPLVVCLPFGLAALVRRRPAAVLVIGTIAVGTVVAYYNPGLAIVRAGWAASSSRFLIPLVAIGAPLSVVAQRTPARRYWLNEYLSLVIVLNATFIGLALTLESSQELRLATVVSLAAAVAWLKRPTGMRLTPITVIVSVVVLLGFWRWKETYRYRVAERS